MQILLQTFARFRHRTKQEEGRREVDGKKSDMCGDSEHWIGHLTDLFFGLLHKNRLKRVQYNARSSVRCPVQCLESPHTIKHPPFNLSSNCSVQCIVWAKVWKCVAVLSLLSDFNETYVNCFAHTWENFQKGWERCWGGGEWGKGCNNDLTLATFMLFSLFVLLHCTNLGNG